MLNRLRVWWEQGSLGRFARKYQADDADTLAALIAFSAVFSLFPLLLGCLTVVGLVLRDPERLAALTVTIQSQFPGDVGELLTFLSETRDISGLLGLVSLLGLLWAGAALVGGITRALNRFYGASERNLLPQKLVEISVIVLFLVLTVASVFASSAASLVGKTSAGLLPSESPVTLVFTYLLGQAFSLAAGLALFLAIFRIVPNAPVSFGGVWRGALLSAALFVLALQIFPLYIRFLGGGFEAYKTLGLLPLLLTWFYLLARIIVIGGSLNAFLRPVVIQAPAELPTPEPGSIEGSPSRNPLLTLGAIGVLLLLLWRGTQGQGQR